MIRQMAVACACAGGLLATTTLLGVIAARKREVLACPAPGEHALELSARVAAPPRSRSPRPRASSRHPLDARRFAFAAR
jgi:hypothetical protein